MNWSGGQRILEAAAGVHVGQDDDLFGAQDLRGLGHEADAAEGDDVGVGRRGLARQIEAVADEIGEVLDRGLLVIMGEDDRVALLLQARDLGEQVETLQALRSVRSLASFLGAAAAAFLDRLLIWDRGGDP